MASDQQNSLVDLEKELTCSICVEVLYHPLTLLDCLHTFCGACLKEWFTWQRQNATSQNPYTCPACRAPVRDTRPNATVTTLLDMYLKAHPERSKSLQDKQTAESAYKPGDNVIPPIPAQPDSDSEDDRMLEQARELSLQDVGSETARRRRTERAERQQRRRRQHDHASSRAEDSHEPSLEHQSSLRSLLSASDVESGGMEEEIMRQIMDEGLLDGIDLDNLTRAQEEQVTERIAQAFRRRQHERGARQTPRQTPDRSAQIPTTTSQRRNHSRSASNPSVDVTPSRPVNDRPPISRPHLLDAATTESRTRRARSSSRGSQASNQATVGHITSGLAVGSASPASRSMTDLSSRPTADSRDHNRRLSRGDRVVTDPEHPTATRRQSRSRTSSGDATTMRRSIAPAPFGFSSSLPVTNGRTAPSPGPLASLRSREGPSNNSSPALVSTSGFQPDQSASRPRTSSHVQQSASLQPSPLFEPTVSAKGCHHWFGFGYSSAIRFQRADLPASTEQPHVLSARRYKKRSSTSHVEMAAPSTRIEEGLFCEGCFAHADTCYWHCDICLGGAWGYCNNCVQQGKHCTHPLEAVANRSARKASTVDRQRHQPMYLLSHDELYPAPLSSASVNTLPQPHLPHVPDPHSYSLVSITSSCDICHRQIPPSHTRYHCYVCSAGDYDICTSCYHSLCAAGKIAPEDGSQGWRRCLRGHRMAVTGFEDREGGQRRVVVRDMVGGWALKEEQEPSPDNGQQWGWREEDGTAVVHPSRAGSHAIDPAQRNMMFPPDGGVGLRVLALWSYFPAGGDELAFPKNAEITEAEDINGDWFWGVFAGRKGLFPGNYGRVISGR
ncbi:hypothetical protein MBLNU457_6342t2 [Dothideomycetes sp. NU457]